jgi:Lon protease-like protein
MTVSLPVFPLNTVLYPGGRLPLKIFEQRYVEMTKACLRDATPFGVCRILDKSTRRDGLIRAEVELLEDAPGDPPPETLSLCRQVLEQIVNRVGRSYFPEPLEFGNPRWVSYRLAEVLPLGMEDKQVLLESRDDSERLRRLQAFLKRVE